MNGGPHAGAQVGGAGMQVAKLLVEHELAARLGLDGVSNSLDAAGEPLEDAPDIATLLHGDDPELILLVYPDQEGLFVVVENAPALGPVALHAGSDEIFVTGDEEEVVVHELLSVLLVHAQQGKVPSGEITWQLLESVLHQVLNLQPLLLGDARGQAESVNASANTDPVNKHLVKATTLAGLVD